IESKHRQGIDAVDTKRKGERRPPAALPCLRPARRLRPPTGKSRQTRRLARHGRGGSSRTGKPGHDQTRRTSSPRRQGRGVRTGTSRPASQAQSVGFGEEHLFSGWRLDNFAERSADPATARPIPAKKPETHGYPDWIFGKFRQPELHAGHHGKSPCRGFLATP